MSTRIPRSAAGEDPQISTRRAVMARDAGLRRISSMTRRIVLGAIALSGGLAVTAANAFHGRTIATGSNASTTSTSQNNGAASQTQSGSDGLSAPQQAPAPAPVQQPVVVSGGS
jgi:hypothetical protein